MMDISKSYIKMCKKAIEIQNLWKPVQGDFMIGRELPQGEEDMFVYGDWIEPDDRYESGWDAFDGYEGLIDTIDFLSSAWLPRQDQLQEMIGGFHPSLKILDHINPEHGWDKELCQNSWEQLWLAFVMKEKFGKTWNGDDWE